MTSAEISPILLAVVIATRKAAFNVRSFTETSLTGSKGGLVRADRTRDKSQGGVVILPVGRILLAPLINLAIQGSRAKALLKKEDKAEI